MAQHIKVSRFAWKLRRHIPRVFFSILKWSQINMFPWGVPGWSHHQLLILGTFLAHSLLQSLQHPRFVETPRAQHTSAATVGGHTGHTGHTWHVSANRATGRRCDASQVRGPMGPKCSMEYLEISIDMHWPKKCSKRLKSRFIMVYPSMNEWCNLVSWIHAFFGLFGLPPLPQQVET
jgi:hypothetical protein